MNATYIRMAFYLLAPIAAALPGVTYDSVAQTVMLDLDTLAMGLSGAVVASGAVFATWGKT